MVRFDLARLLLQMLFLFGAAITALFLMDHEKVGNRGESYVLMLASTIGMCLMASAADLVMLYLAIETTCIPLYILAGFMLSDDRSTESGFKYMLYGAMTSAVMLYGFSLLFGFAGYDEPVCFGFRVKAGQVPAVGVLGHRVPDHCRFRFQGIDRTIPLLGAGRVRRLSHASSGLPFHCVEGGGLRGAGAVFLVAFPDFAANWTTIIAVVSAVTMTVGNLLALPQKNLKRMLAYSSIAHAGYAMIGIVAVSQLGIASVVFYMLAYIVTNLAAFGIVMAVGRIVGSDEYDAYRGLSRRAPGLSLIMLAAFLSLAGMPPFGGFIAKVVVFAAGVQANYVWLVVIGILNSVVGVYYYLNVMKYVYLYRMEGENEDRCPIPLTRPYVIALAVLAIGVVLIGTVFAPWFGYSNAAAVTLF